MTSETMDSAGRWRDREDSLWYVWADRRRGLSALKIGGDPDIAFGRGPIRPDGADAARYAPFAPDTGGPAAARPWRPEAAPGTATVAGRTVSFPPVRSFGRLERDKWLAVKTLEEAAELTEAAKRWLKSGAAADRRDMLDEYADTLQTLANLAAAMGVSDAEIADAMDDCLERNRERGRL
ncbi:pyrophosphohydrolase domain-containing protein [Bifidobacterium myosotis]|uniref:hypothetical protein n=1 Tax=Bifidobacterium myosotis TaxID=1630166 RepID=UPI001CC27DDC|nr:hypothetical protein [Bifidobacterium myosotis]